MLKGFITLHTVTAPGNSRVEFDEDTGEEKVIPGEEMTLEGDHQVIHIRSYVVRKPDHNGTARTGCRVTFMNGTAVAVTDTIDDIRAKIAQATG